MKFEAQGLQTWSFTRRFIPNFYLETGSLPDYADSYFWPAISISDTNNACGNCWNSATSKHLEKYCSNWKCFVQPNVLIVDKVWITPRNSKLLWVEPCEGRMLSGTLMRNKYWGIKMFILDTGNALGILYSLCLNSFPPTPLKWRSNTDEWCYIDGYDKSGERRCLGNLQALSSERYSWLWMRGWFLWKVWAGCTLCFSKFGFSGSKWKLNCCSTGGDWFPVQFKGIWQHQHKAHVLVVGHCYLPDQHLQRVTWCWVAAALCPACSPWKLPGIWLRQ